MSKPYRRRYATIKPARRLALQFIAGQFDPDYKKVGYLTKKAHAKLFKPLTYKVFADTWHYD